MTMQSSKCDAMGRIPHTPFAQAFFKSLIAKAQSSKCDAIAKAQRLIIVIILSLSQWNLAAADAVEQIDELTNIEAAIHLEGT